MTELKLGEDDMTQDTWHPERERPGEPGNYYYDDSTGYELYEPTTSGEEDEPDEPGTTISPSDCCRTAYLT